MQLKRRVALRGIYLDEIDDRILVSSVEPAEGKDNISAADSAAGFGQRITGKRRSTLDIIVKFRILEHGRSVAGQRERAWLLEKVNAWAAPGGVLTVNYKPSRRLNVVLAQAATEGSLWEYTKEFQLTFRAYAIPYWEDLSASAETFGTAQNGSRTITVEGSADTQANVELKNRSGANITECTVTVGGNTMTFKSIGLAGGETLVIDHNMYALVRIRIRGTDDKYRDVMAKRSETSANDLLISPGDVACSYSATRACQMTVTWRARYL